VPDVLAWELGNAVPVLAGPGYRLRLAPTGAPAVPGPWRWRVVRQEVGLDGEVALVVAAEAPASVEADPCAARRELRD